MSDKVKYLKSTQEFDDLINKERLVLIDFWATWCAPCRMLAPIIDKLAEQYDGKVTIGKVDVDEVQEVAYRFGIQSITTVILFKEGKLIAKEIGVKPLNTFVKLLDSQTA